jgi:hypothetical protein
MSGQSEVLSLIRLLRPARSSFRKVRVGSLGDGGYVLPDDLQGITNVLSIGIGEEVSFDLHFAKQGIPIYQYDPTVIGPPIQHDNFQFHKVAWSHEDGEKTATLSNMVRVHGLNATSDAILKFDTEGAEWQSIRNTPSDILKHFRIIACELHGFNSLHNPAFMQEVRQTMQLLTRHHTVVHLHANNCCGISLVEGVPVPAVVELTLLRNDRSDFFPSHEPIPGPLDYPNMPDRPDLVLSPYA